MFPYIAHFFLVVDNTYCVGGQALGYTSIRELRVETLVTHVGIGSQGPLLSHAVSTKVFSSTMNYTRVGLINV